MFLGAHPAHFPPPRSLALAEVKLHSCPPLRALKREAHPISTPSTTLNRRLRQDFSVQMLNLEQRRREQAVIDRFIEKVSAAKTPHNVLISSQLLSDYEIKLPSKRPFMFLSRVDLFPEVRPDCTIGEVLRVPSNSFNYHKRRLLYLAHQLMLKVNQEKQQLNSLLRIATELRDLPDSDMRPLLAAILNQRDLVKTLLKERRWLLQVYGQCYRFYRGLASLAQKQAATEPLPSDGVCFDSS